MSDTLNTKETKLVMRNTEYCTSTIEYNGNSYKMSTEGNLKQIKDKNPENSMMCQLIKRLDSIDKEMKEIKKINKETNSRLNLIDNDLKLIKSLPTIAKELSELE